MKEASLRAAIIAQGMDLIRTGLVAGTWGNISVRLSHDTVLITPSGRPYQTLKPEDIIKVNLSGTVLEGSLKPSSETPLHLSVYSVRPDIEAIVHTHSVFASACAAARREIPPLIEDLAQAVGGPVKVARYALPGTEDLAEQAVAALGERYAVLLANHGVLGCGDNLEQAAMICQLVEKAAQIYIYAEQIGGAVVLSDQDTAGMHAFYRAHYRKRQGGEE